MKILFTILAHNAPEKVAELALTLTAAATDARATIHFDANASKENYLVLEDLAKHHDKISLVSRRIACQWGGYSLVDAVLSAIREQRDLGNSYDYVVLLSGACLPCRPIKQLERYLNENYGKEFIEAHDENWMIGGLRKERYQFYWPFPPSPSPTKSSHYWTLLQRLLKIKRTVPLGMEVRFGSQWWTLTWNTCTAMIDFMDKYPKIEKFFRKTYIPDEMMINTLVWHLINREKIAGFGLTHFQFTNYGKPIVFFDDHKNYPLSSINKFFYRKVSNEANELRKNSLARALANDDGEELSEIGTVNSDYFIKTKTQTDFPTPGQMYYRDQFTGMRESVLRRDKRPYIFVCGMPDAVQHALTHLKSNDFQIIGRVFEKNQINWFNNADNFEGLDRNEVKIRDLHPLLYLQRIRRRATRIPLFAWAPGDKKPPLDTIIYDDNACIISLPPMAENGHASRKIMSCPPARSIPGVGEEEMEKVLLEMANPDIIPERLASGIDGQHFENTIVYPIGAHNTLTAFRAQDIFESSLEKNKYKNEPWMLHVIKILLQEFSHIAPQKAKE